MIPKWIPEMLTREGTSLQASFWSPRYIGTVGFYISTYITFTIFVTFMTSVARSLWTLVWKRFDFGPSILTKVKLSTIDEVYLSSSSDAQTFVNGRLLNGRIELKSGSRIIFGAAHVFRFVHPSKIQTLKNEMNSGNDYPSQGKNFNDRLPRSWLITWYKDREPTLYWTIRCEDQTRL